MVSVKVTAQEANDIVCPYTGKKLEVYMTVQPGSIVFNAPEAFTPHVPVKSVDELYDRASTRGGVAGMVSGADLMKDPYTGETFSLDQLPDGRFRFVGGFNPRSACKTLGEFLYKVTMRGGVASRNPPVDLYKVSKVLRGKPVAKSKKIEVSEETAKAADRAVRDSGMFQKKTSVTFSGAKGKR